MSSIHLKNTGEIFGLLSNRMSRLLRLRFRKELKKLKLELNEKHFGVLLDLWTRDGVKQQELAVTSIKDKAAITRSLDELERMKVIVRVSDEKDRRNKLIYLTISGKELRNELVPLINSITNRALDGISSEEYRVFLRVLKKMYLNLRNRC